MKLICCTFAIPYSALLERGDPSFMEVKRRRSDALQRYGNLSSDKDTDGKTRFQSTTPITVA
jgi:hypothetical protein